MVLIRNSGMTFEAGILGKLMRPFCYLLISVVSYIGRQGLQSDMLENYVPLSVSGKGRVKLL